MAFISCPNCQSDFFSQPGARDFVCPACRQYFQLDAVEEETCSPQDDERPSSPEDDIPVNGDFDGWAAEEAQWMSDHVLEPNYFDESKEPSTQLRNKIGSSSGSLFNGKQVKSAEKMLDEEISNSRLKNQRKITCDGWRDNYSSHEDKTCAPVAQANIDRSIAITEIESEPAIFKITLPAGSLVVVSQYILDFVNPVFFIFIAYAWGFLSFVALGIYLGLGGGSRVIFGVWSTLSLLFFVLLLLLSIPLAIFSGGSGSSPLFDCIEVGRYGEEECF